MRYYFFEALKILVFCLVFIPLHGQTSKSIPDRWSASSSNENADLMCILIKAPNEEFPQILVEKDSLLSNVEIFMKNYSNNYEILLHKLSKGELELITVTRENYYSLIPEKQIELKTMLSSMEDLFMKEMQIGLLASQTFLVSKNDFEVIIQVISNE